MSCSRYWSGQIESRLLKATAQKKAFKRHVHEWADRLEVKIVWLGVRPMQNKWASCSTSGHLNFNTELLQLDEAIWDYVIVHELLQQLRPVGS